MEPQYILLTGCTGVGKSTLSDSLWKYLEEPLYYSDPYINNPFISDVYTGSKNKHFQSEIFFLKEFLKIHRCITRNNNRWIIQERSIFECVYVFCRMFLLQSKIDADEYQLCVDLLAELSQGIKIPDKIIYLKATPMKIIERIQHRKRDFEQNIDLDFIQLQQNIYEEWLANFHYNYHTEIIEIDNTQMNIEQTNKELLRKLQNSIPCQ